MRSLFVFVFRLLIVFLHPSDDFETKSNAPESGLKTSPETD